MRLPASRDILHNMNSIPLTIFLDGVCHLCSFEARYIQKHAAAGTYRFIDISDENFSASPYNLNVEAINDSLHAMKSNGEILKGMDAMIEIWSHVPNLRWLSQLSGLPLFYQLFSFQYWVFKKIRKRLPKRKKSVMCEL